MKKILILLLLIAIGQLVALFFWILFDFSTELFPPMVVSSVLVWLLYLNQNKNKS